MTAFRSHHPRRPDSSGLGLRRWSASLLAIIAVVGPAARDAEARATPRIEAVSFANSPVRGDTYELGEKIEVLVRFDRSVEVIGSLEADSALKVVLTIGARTRHAQLQGISLEGRNLEFYYTVRADDRDADGISVAAGELLRDNATVTAVADSNIEAVLTHETVAAAADRKVDGSRVREPRVSSIIYHVTQTTRLARRRPMRWALRVSSIIDRVTARGQTYRRDQRIEVSVEFDRAVRVTGVPQMALTIGTETRWANFVPNHPVEYFDPERTIFFCYTVRQEDRDTDGISIPANALSLNGGAITLAGDAEADAVLNHAAVAAFRYGKVNGNLSAASDPLPTGELMNVNARQRRASLRKRGDRSGVCGQKGRYRKLEWDGSHPLAW